MKCHGIVGKEGPLRAGKFRNSSTDDLAIEQAFRVLLKAEVVACVEEIYVDTSGWRKTETQAGGWDTHSALQTGEAEMRNRHQM